MTEMAAWAASFATAQRSPGEVVSWVDRTSAAVLSGVEEVAASDLAGLLHQAVEEHWLAFLDRMFSDEPFELVEPARQLAVELARRHLGLPVLLRIYRVAQEASWDFATDVVRHAPGDLDHEALLIWFWSKAGAWFNASVDQSVLLHQTEAARIQQRGDAQRYEVVARLLGGDVAAEDPAVVSAALGGHPVSGSHVALIAHALTADAIAHLEPALLRVATRIGPARPVLVRPGGREVWAWLPAATRPLASPGPTPEPTSVDLDPAIRVTLGGPATGLGGFVSAHRDAVTAQRVALADRRARSVTAYDDVAVLALLAADREAAERFVSRTLGRLAEPAAASLRETARAVLTTPGGATAVATRLGVHPNTVRYRVGQAERLLRGALPELAGDLLVALDYYDAFLGQP